MAYEYGVNLKLDSEKALKDIDVLLGKLKQMEDLAKKVKLNVTMSNDLEKQQQQFLRSVEKQRAAEQKLATQRVLDEERIQQAQNKTATQRATSEEKVRQEQQKTATEAEKQAMDVLKANEKVRQEKERTRQESERTARSEQKTNQETIRTKQQEVEFVNKLFTLYQRVSREREHEEDRLRRIANAEKRATEQAEKRAAAVAKAVAARQKEEMISQATSGLFTASRRYATVGRIGQIGGSVLNNVAQSMGLIQQAASQLTNNLWGYAQRIGSQIVSQVEKIASTALEQYKTLETAEIGFGNFFNGSPAAFTQQVRQRAEEMPGVGAQDLVRGIQYIAPLAGGNSQLALNAAEGVMKSILYSGNDVSAYGTNALQNLQQLASGNFTYADIRQMLRAMPTLPSLLASNDKGKELLDNGAITTEKMKAYIKKYGQSSILELFAEISSNSAASDIYDKYRKTLSGAIEETGEHIKNAWNDAMENAGVYRTITQFLNKIVDNKVLDEAFKKLGDVVAKVLNWFKNEKNADEIKAYFNTLKTVLKSFKTVLGQVAKDLGQSLGFLNADGTLNTSGLRQLTRQLAEFVKGLVKGFGGGLKTVIDLAKRFADSMGADGWRKLGEIIGTLASPLGKLITLLTKFGAAVSSIVGAFGTSTSGIFKWLGNGITNKLESLLGTAAMTNAGFTTANSTAGTSVAGLLVSSASKKGASAAASAATRAQKIANVAAYGSGVLRAGVFDMVIQSLGNLAAEFIKTSNAFGDNTPGVVTAIKTASSAIGTFALLFKVGGGGIVGGILGGVGALLAGLQTYTNSVVEQAREIQSKKDEELRKQVEEAAPGYIDKVAKEILDSYTGNGGKIDLETEEGRAAYDNLKNYIQSKIVKYDDYGNFVGVNPDALKGQFSTLFNFFVDDYKQQLLNSGMVDYTASEGFYNAAQGGTKIDLDKNPELRKQAADLIRAALLNGTDAAEGGVYDYGQSDEKVVRDYLETIGMSEFTTGALEALLNQSNSLDADIKPNTDAIKEAVANSENEIKTKLENGVDGIQTATEHFDDTLDTIAADVAQIALNTGGNIAAMHNLSESQVKQWDSHGLLDYVTNWDKAYVGNAIQKNDSFGAVVKNLSDATSAEALKRADKTKSADERKEAQENYTKYSKMLDELADINPNDWTAFRNWLRKNKKYASILGIVDDYYLASGGVVGKRKVKPVYRAGGGRGVDTVPAYLQPGEYVMRQRAASLAGGSVLNALNNGDLGSAARLLGAKVSGHWNNSRSYARTINNNQKTVTNNVTVNNRTRAGGLNSYWSLANRMAASF